MAKSFVFGNGSMTVGLDVNGQVYDLCYPFVGLENHTGGAFVHKVGVFANGKINWIDDSSWQKDFSYVGEDFVSNKICLTNSNIGIKLDITDEVYNEKNILLRSFKLTNLFDSKQSVKLFLNQQFEIYESHRGDTAYYDPESNVVIHYKGRRVFLVNGVERETGKPFSEYSVGLLGIEGKRGTFADTEDGILEKNPIEHGLTDSVIGFEINLEPGASKNIDYWICVSKFMDEVYEDNSYVLKKTSEYLINSTRNYWKAWMKRFSFDFADLGQPHQRLFENSLRVMRIQTDNTGAVIASIDSDLLKYGRDGYNYVWPRDAAFTSIAFSRVGIDDITKKIFEFFKDTITSRGYFMHKYRADKALGSSWHPWVYKGLKELPIQIDETALPVIAVWEDYKRTHDTEFIETIYNDLILKSVEFLITRINPQTGVVAPSYDLWEEKFGSHTFSSAAVFGALNAASEIAGIFGKTAKSEEYKKMADLVKTGILTQHYDNNEKRFYKSIMPPEYHHGNEPPFNSTVDSSVLYGLFRFGVLDADDPLLLLTQTVTEEKLKCQKGISGFARYDGDIYFKAAETIAGNPWIITTMWYAQLKIAQSKNLSELSTTKALLDWAVEVASHSGLLSEQINPFDKSQISATPLTWSHAEYVNTVMDYLEKYKKLALGGQAKLTMTL